MTIVRHADGNIEAVLQRARAEEAVERERGNAPGEGLRTRRVAEIESPVLRLNRRAVRRKVSTFTMILLLFGVATISVIYIGHIITMNHLAVDAANLQDQYESLVREGGRVRAEIDRKSARERIVGIATSELGLRLPNGQAQWITIDQSQGKAPSDPESR